MQPKLISTKNRYYECKFCDYGTRLKYLAKKHIVNKHFDEIFNLNTENIRVKLP